MPNNWPVTGNDWQYANWQRQDIKDAFIAAATERQINNLPSLPTSACQGPFWGYLYNSLQNSCDRYTKSHDISGASPVKINLATAYNGFTPAENPDWGFTEAWAWKVVSGQWGLHAAGWTFPELLRAVYGRDVPGWRRVSGPDLPADWTNLDDPAYTWSTIGWWENWGIVGPWVMHDIQKAFNFLRWRYVGGTLIGGDGQYKDAGNAGYNWNDTLVAARAAYNAASPTAITGGCWKQSMSYLYNSEFSASYSTGTLSPIVPNFFGGNVDDSRAISAHDYIYVFGRPDYGNPAHPEWVFDANGTNVLDNQLQLFEGPISHLDIRQPQQASLTLGTLDCPADPPYPQQGNTSYYKGYQAAFAAIQCFDVTGGFDYLLD